MKQWYAFGRQLKLTEALEFWPRGFTQHTHIYMLTFPLYKQRTDGLRRPSVRLLFLVILKKTEEKFLFHNITAKLLL